MNSDLEDMKEAFKQILPIYLELGVSHFTDKQLKEFERKLEN